MLRLSLALLLACKPTESTTGPADEPPVAVEEALDLPERPFDYHAITLDNGMQVITLEDHSTPIAAVQVWYHVGSKDEKPNRRGFAHMFEHMMFRGTQNIGPKAHFEHIRRVGGWANAFTSFDNTTYVQVVPSNQVEIVMWLEAERMGFLKINDGYFDTERKVVAEEFRRGQESPYGTAPEKLLGQIFTKHPYRWSPIGDMNELAEADAKELQEFWETYYVPNNAALVVVGDVDHEEVEAMAKRHFGWIPKYDDPPRVTVREPAQKKQRRIKIKERNGPVPIAGVLFRTVPMGHEDELALEVLGHILGGGESSRLWKDLVREQDLAMFALAGVFTLEHDGAFAAGAAMSPFGASPDKALAAIRGQIAKIRKDGVSAEELAKAKANLLRTEVTSLLTVQSKALKLGEAALIKKDLGAVNRAFKDIASVTAADVKKAAEVYLTQEREIEIRVEPNLLGFIVDQIRGGDDEPEEQDTGKEEISGAGEGKPGLTRPEDLPKSPTVGPPLAADVDVATTRATLDNGLEVVVIPNTEVPFVRFHLGLHYGAFADPAGKPGTAWLTLPMLARGTDEHDYSALTEELGRHAITLSGSASMDASSVSATALRHEAERAIGLMAEAVIHPTFPAEELDEHRQQSVTGLMITERSPEYLADRELRRRLFKGHPYERLPEGKAADLHKITRDDLAAWWKTHARPDAAVLYVAGDIEAKEALALAKTHFGGWTAKGDKPAIAVPDPPKAAKTKIYLVDRGGNQSQIRVGHVSITRRDARYPTARLTTEYFGGGFNSRLNDTIRVQKGLTYGARGGFSPDRFAGRFTVSTFSKNATVGETVETILEEVARFEKEGPTDKEAADAKSYIVGSFAGARETPEAIVRDLWRIETQGLPEDYYGKYLEAVRNVDPAKAVDTVKELVRTDELVIIIVGPANRLRNQLAKIAEIEVVKAD